jgi:hypothetical protein
MEGSGRGIISGTVPAFVWRGWGESRKASVRKTGLVAEILNRVFQITK